MMYECTITEPHEPHCPKCGGPVSIWFYEDLEPGAVVSASMCQADCLDVVPCDGGLSSQIGDWQTLNNREADRLTLDIIAASEGRADQCLHQPGCTNQPIDAHTVPRNWLRQIGPNHVYLFRPSPRPTAPPGQIPAIPHRVSIRRATTAGFACAEHDAVFQPADQRSMNIKSPDRLNLLFYRAVLKALHGQIMAQQVARTHLRTVAESMGYEITVTNQRRYSTLSLASGLLRTSLSHPVLNWRIKHVTKALSGTPRIACSNAGVWDHHWVDFWSGPVRPVESHGVWGITVMPTEDGHVAMLHYCTVATDRYIAERHLSKMAQEMAPFEELEGLALEEAISSHAIVLTEDLCVGSFAWESYSQQRKEVIRRAWTSNSWIPNEEFGHVNVKGISREEFPSLNLFR